MPYITLSDIRDEGIPDPPTDATILSTITVCEQLVDRVTRQWFELRPATFKLDGNGRDTLHLPVPIIAIEHVRLNDSDENLDTDLFEVYDSRLIPDDRRNPRIKLVSHQNLHDIYTAPERHGHRLNFRKGRQNQEIKGDFGFLEPDDTTPEAIKRATKIIVIEKLLNPLFTDTSAPPVLPPPPPILGTLLEERTDDHSRKYAPAGGGVSDRQPGLSGITDNREFWDLVRLYRAPISVKAPSHFSPG
ncbi:hypothetical protein LCGC14_0835800 [marine sediment metagenome]|uniref:Uncharacterized protein n=1 Tax=marine sediment metagenome TaxID=412755 RepID=A0A0F9PEQ1_9ZZZZ